MTDNLFQDNDEPQFDQDKNYLEELVGEGKKFKTHEDLAKGKFYADTQISILTKKLDEMRQDYLALKEDNTAKDTLQELLDKIESGRNGDVAPNPNANEDKSGLKLEDVKSLFSEELTRHETAKVERENFNSIQNKLNEVHGANAQAFLKEQMQSLGLSKEVINEMARKQPRMLERALGLDRPKQKENFQAPPHSHLRNDNFAPTGQQKRTWSYYQEMRKKNPGLYHDPKINIQMQKDAIELGDAFMDGDFNT